MNHTFNLRIKIFVVAVLIIVLGQIGYSIHNVKLFQTSYISALKEKCNKMAEYVDEDVEKILSMGIPLNKLIKLEETLQSILTAVPELENIQITDTQGTLLYLADHTRIMRVETPDVTTQPLSTNPPYFLRILGLTPKATEISLSIFNPAKKIQAGFIKLHLSDKIILKKTKVILLDMLTIIMTSLLITIEFLGFFIAHEIAFPLRNLSQKMQTSIATYTPITQQQYFFMDELGSMVEHFNSQMYYILKRVGTVLTIQNYFPRFKKSLTTSIEEQQHLLASLQTKEGETTTDPTSSLADQSSALLGQITSKIQTLGSLLDSFSFSQTSSGASTSLSPYVFIRPIMFLFVMADGFSISFLPMYIDSLYQPIFGLSREVILAIPISLYMLMLALGMPFSGGLLDSRGWYKTLMLGMLLNTTGHVLTGLAQNLIQLIAFRSLTAVGFAIVFMSCQQYVITTTSLEKRALGMSSLIAAFFSGDICGTVIGGMMADRVGYSGVFFLSGFFAFLSAVSAFFVLHKHRPAERSAKKTSWLHLPFSLKDLFSVFKDRESCALIFFQAIPSKMVLIGFLYYFVPLYLQNIHVLQSDIGRIITCYGLALVFFGPVFSKYLDTKNLRKKFIIIGGLITGASLCAFYYDQGRLPIILIVLSLGIAHTFSVSSQSAMISNSAMVRRLGSGTGMGIFRFWERTGNVLGPLVLGFFIAKSGYTTTMVILGAFSLTTTLAYCLLDRFILISQDVSKK